MKKAAIVLLSGGLDSAVAALIAKKYCKIKLALTFNYGQRAAVREISAARAFCKKYKIEHKVINLNWLKSISNSALTDKRKNIPIFSNTNSLKKRTNLKKCAAKVWVPNRNALFVNIAASYAESMNCKYIIGGFNLEEAQTFIDNSTAFIRKSNELLLYSTQFHPKLISPVQKMNKREIVQAAMQLKIDPRFFWSCYEGGAKMCGVCESCMRIIDAFIKNNAWTFISGKFKESHVKINY